MLLCAGSLIFDWVHISQRNSLFITTCHSMLQEDKIPTVLWGRSSFSWSCSLSRLQEVSLFFLGKWRKCVWREKWASAMPPEVCAGRDTPGLRLWSCLMSWIQGRLDGKPPRTSPSAYRSGAAPAYSLGVKLARVPAQETRGTCCSWRCYHCSLAFIASWCLSLKLKLVFGSSRSSRTARLSWRPWHPPGLSDCPQAPDVLRAARSRLTGTASRTTPSTLSVSEGSKVWSREVLKVIQQQPKIHVCSLVFAVTRRWLWNYRKWKGDFLVVAKCSP